MVTVAGEHFVTILERLGNMGDGEQGRSPPPLLATSGITKD